MSKSPRRKKIKWRKWCERHPDRAELRAFAKVRRWAHEYYWRLSSKGVVCFEPLASTLFDRIESDLTAMEECAIPVILKGGE